MKVIALICSAFLFIGIFTLPIGYYTFLRITVSISALLIVISEYKSGINLWVIVFGIIAILFNPILPIYLHSKEIWGVIDAISGLIFATKGFSKKAESHFKSSD